MTLEHLASLALMTRFRAMRRRGSAATVTLEHVTGVNLV